MASINNLTAHRAANFVAPMCVFVLLVVMNDELGNGGFLAFFAVNKFFRPL